LNIHVKVVDTILVKLFAQSEKTSDLYTLLNEAHNVVLQEVEPALQKYGQYNALCTLYKQLGEDEKLLNAWSKYESFLFCVVNALPDARTLRVADGEWMDDDIPDPISNIVSLIADKRDRALTQQWGLWLTKRDPERGLKVLHSPSSRACD